MKFVTEIGSDGLRRRPAGVRQDVERRHLQCVTLTLLVLLLQCLQIAVKEYIWEHNQLYLAAQDSYVDHDALNTPMRLDQVEETHGALLQGLVYNPKLNVYTLVGRPRVRLLYIKNETCLYPVQNTLCYGKLTLDGDTESEIDTEKGLTDVTLDGVQCPPRLNTSNITLEYLEDVQMDYLNSQACFNCKYPLGGHVLDIPRPNATIQPLEEYATWCLASLNTEIFDKLVDESTRLIQVEVIFYNVYFDIFVRVTVAFEEFDLNRWWPSYKIETGHFLGVAGRGDYHGAIDDSKLLVFPALVLALILLRLRWEPKEGRMKRYLLTLITVGLTIYRLYSQANIVLRYEEVLDALPSEPRNHTRLGRMEQLMNTDQHFPFEYLMAENKTARVLGIALVMLSLLHLCQYENYQWVEVTLLAVAIRKALKYSLPFILYYLFLNFVFAVIGHTLFGTCSSLFSEKTEAFITLLKFEFSGDMDYSELMVCAPVWGEIFFFLASVVLYMVLFNFTFTYVFGVMTEVRRLKARQFMLEEHDNLMEKINWPVTRCHRGADLSLENQLRLVKLYDFISSRGDEAIRSLRQRE
uniref:Polycystin cation channel PKD1/PKD2 domain-containing protein n=1 Tax=Scylla olivacea TaxID=85551 RepID=A0A0P4W5B1_SCYOL